MSDFNKQKIKGAVYLPVVKYCSTWRFCENKPVDLVTNNPVLYPKEENDIITKYLESLGFQFLEITDDGLQRVVLPLGWNVHEDDCGDRLRGFRDSLVCGKALRAGISFDKEKDSSKVWLFKDDYKLNLFSRFLPVYRPEKHKECYMEDLLPVIKDLKMSSEIIFREHQRNVWEVSDLVREQTVVGIFAFLEASLNKKVPGWKDPRLFWEDERTLEQLMK